MNKLLLSLSFMVLLAGCDKPAEAKVAELSVKQQPPVATEPTPAPTPVSSEIKPVIEPSAAAPVNNDAVTPLVIDASSEQTMTTSLDKMIVPLSDTEKEAFAEAFLVYAMSKVDMKLDEATNQKNMLAALNGKSVKDIMQEAEKIKASVEKVEK